MMTCLIYSRINTYCARTWSEANIWFPAFQDTLKCMQDYHAPLACQLPRYCLHEDGAQSCLSLRQGQDLQNLLERHIDCRERLALLFHALRSRCVLQRQKYPDAKVRPSYARDVMHLPLELHAG